MTTYCFKLLSLGFHLKTACNLVLELKQSTSSPKLLLVTVFHHSSASGTEPSPLPAAVSSGCPVASPGHRDKGCHGDHTVEILLTRSSHLQILTAFFPKSSWYLLRSPPTMHLCQRHCQATALPRLPFHTHPQPEKLGRRCAEAAGCSSMPRGLQTAGRMDCPFP